MAFIDVVPMPQRLANLLDHTRHTAATEPGWHRIENADGGDDDTATVMIYSEIGGYYGVDVADFAREISAITAGNILLRLDSPGGSVNNGIAVANLLRSHSARVTVSVDGMAASIASVIAMAGDEILMQPQSQMMIHRAWGLCIGNKNDMGKVAEVLERQDVNIAKAYAARAGGRYDTWLNRMDAESWYTAEEAVAAGLADKVVSYPKKKTPDAEPDPAARSDTRVWDLSVFRYQGRGRAPDPFAEPPNGGALGLLAPDFAERFRDACGHSDEGVSLLTLAGVPPAGTAPFRAFLRSELTALGLDLPTGTAEDGHPPGTDGGDQADPPAAPADPPAPRLAFGRRTTDDTPRTLAFGQGGTTR